MKKILGLFILIIALTSLGVLAATETHDFSQAQELLAQKLAYEELTDDQFEIIGDYFMELMVGDRHEIMDEMMGGEGSESLRDAHIVIGKNNYQNYIETGEIGSYGMMGNSGMMGKTPFQNSNGNLNYIGSNNMMSYGMFGMGLYGLIYLALGAFIFGAIFWLTYKLIIGDSKKKK